MRWTELAAGIASVKRPTYYQCEPSWRWKFPLFVDFDLWIVLGGEGELLISGRRYAMSRGGAVLFKPGDSVEGMHNPKKPFRVFAVHFELRDTGLSRRLVKVVPQHWQFHDIARCELNTMALVQSSEAPSMDGMLELGITQLLAQGVADSASPRLDPVDEKLKAICLEMTANPGANWDPPILARQTGLSLPQFNRRFRAFAGKSPMRYLITRRIDRARRLLAETPLSLSEIAHALGYSDVFYFHRQFRAETGVTPGELRGKA